MYRGRARAEIKTCAPVTEASSALRFREGHLILVVSPFLFVYCFPGLAHVALPWAKVLLQEYSAGHVLAF